MEQGTDDKTGNDKQICSNIKRLSKRISFHLGLLRGSVDSFNLEEAGNQLRHHSQTATSKCHSVMHQKDYARNSKRRTSFHPELLVQGLDHLDHYEEVNYKGACGDT